MKRRPRRLQAVPKISLAEFDWELPSTAPVVEGLTTRTWPQPRQTAWGHFPESPHGGVIHLLRFEVVPEWLPPTMRPQLQAVALCGRKRSTAAVVRVSRAAGAPAQWCHECRLARSRMKAALARALPPPEPSGRWRHTDDNRGTSNAA